MRLSLVILVLAFLAGAAHAQIGAVVSNWTVPSSSSSSSSGLHHSRTLGDVTNALPLVGVTPCRIVDTRGPAGPYGAPSLPASTPRSFALLGGPCAGLPVGVSAYSLNITVTNTLGPGFISLYPTGGPAPVVSTLNYVAAQTIANAAIVPAGTGGAITAVAGVSGTDLIIDINGYFPTGSSSQLLNPGVHFEIAGNVSPPFATVNSRNNSTTDGAMAVLGIGGGATGATFAVEGQNASITSHAAGMLGMDGAGVFDPNGSPSFSAGVIGNGRNGVIGRTSTGGGDGVAGVAQNGSGTATGFGVVGIGTNSFLGIVGDIACGGCVKSFIDPHPTDPSKVIRYVSLEGNEAGTYFRGTAYISEGTYTIDVPEDFRMVTDPEGLTVQLTPVGAPATMYVVTEDLNQIVVHSSADVKFHYLVQGIRPGYKNYNPIQGSMENAAFLPQTSEGQMQNGWPQYVKQRLVANGTYHSDGTINMQTAERVGWARVWQQREEEARAAAAKTAEALASRE